MKVKKLFLSTSHLCRCVGCKNPYGKREKKEKLTRKMRHPHALQINLSKSNKLDKIKVKNWARILVNFQVNCNAREAYMQG